MREAHTREFFDGRKFHYSIINNALNLSMTVSSYRKRHRRISFVLIRDKVVVEYSILLLCSVLEFSECYILERNFQTIFII